MIKNKRAGAPEWRDEVKVCPVCEEKFWPEDGDQKWQWERRNFCSRICGGKQAAATARKRAEQTKRA